MTALCPGGGTSSPKPGHAAVVKYSAGLVASIFAAYDLAWLIPVIPLLSFSDQVLATFCATDPPAVVTLTSAEADAVLNLKFGGDFDTGLQKVFNVYVNAVWHDACQCDAGTATPFAPPAPPAGTPIFQPPVNPLVAPCYSKTQSSTPGFYSVGGSNIGAAGVPVGANVTSQRLTVTNVTDSGAGNTLLQTSQPTPPTSPITNYINTGNIAPGATVQKVSAWVPGATQASQLLYYISGSGTSHVDWTVELFCNGDIPGFSQPSCCPPDVATQATLDIILKQVNLLQRQLAPFAYVPGTAHAGLTGTGNIEIAGLLGISVTLTTLPGWLGDIAGTPHKLFDAGYVTFGVDDGYDATYRVDHTSRAFLPPRSSAYTDLGYSFPAGVVATITELVREP